MRLISVRHTKPLVEPGVCYGQLDLRLVDDPTAEIDTACDSVSSMIAGAPVRVVSSPLSRCTVLAGAVARACGVSEPVIDPDAIELSFGDWEGKRWSEIPSNLLQPWMDDWTRATAGSPGSGGESLPNLLVRVSRLIERWRYEPIVVLVTHAGVIRCLMHLLMQLSLEEAWGTHIEYGAVTEFL